MFPFPLELRALLGELSQWFGDVTEIGDEFSAIGGHAKKTPDFTTSQQIVVALRTDPYREPLLSSQTQ